MKLQPFAVRNSLFILVVMVALAGVRAAGQTKPESSAAGRAAAVPARITQAIDEARMVQLKGNVHPLARAEFDQGAVSNATPMKRMMLLLQRSPEQEAALELFMAEQMSKESPNFHKWLTPEEFGRQFGPADADIQTVTSWLTSQGFTGIRVNRGKAVIEFNGNVGQVRSAFHTDIHKFVVNGDERQANISDPQIPAALTPVVAGIVSLHNFPMQSMRRVLGQFTHSRDTGEITPQFTGSGGSFFALGPADFAKIYNVPASLDGTGGNIAIIGFSDIDVSDAHAFRALFGLPVNDPVVVLNGADPGFNGEEGEADLDVQWSGAVAPKAKIHYINSEGTLTSDPIFLGAEYVIDNNTDDVMSLSFGACEARLPAAQNAFFNSLWKQAAAQGITVTVSSGDSGSAGCDNFNTQTTAARGIAVNGIASTPFNIAVGGTDFDDVGTQLTFWSATNSVDGKRESALGYIHEVPWNDSCAATATPTNLTTCASANNIVAGSGGPSILYAKPSFQSGITPNGIAASDNHRYVPDVSLFASDGPSSKSFYVVCQADAISPGSPPSCAPDALGHFSFFGVGGTSASSPSFAGIVALIGQSEAAAGRSRRQGNANLVLYKIAATAANNCNSSTTPLTGSTTCAFYDVTKGNNSVPCAGASSGCSSTTAGTNGVLVTVNGATKTPAFSTTAGTGSIPSYDLATGLGTVNVANLATAWGTAIGTFKATNTSLKLNGGTAPVTITHGQPVTATVTVAPSSGAAMPTGNVSLIAPTTVNGGIGFGTLSGNNPDTASITTTFLPGGSYALKAHYAGDGTFAASDDPTGVSVVVNKENSKLQMGIVTFNAAGTITSTNATSFGYGSPYILRFDVLNSTGTATNCQPLATGTSSGCARDATGTVTITDNGNPLDGGTFIVNSEGHSEDQPIQLTGGAHSLVATYSGDNSYNPSVPVTDNVTVTLAATTMVLTPAATTVQANQSTTLSVAISSQSNSASGPTGNVTFKDGTTTIGTATVVPAGAVGTAGASATAVLNTSFTTTGVHALSVVYPGDTNYATSTSASVNVTVTSPGSFTVGGSAVAVMAGASQASTITVTPSGGFTGTVNVTCPAAGLPAGVTCTPNPLAINVTSAAAATGQLTVNVAGPSTTLTASAAPAERTLYAAGLIPPRGGKGWWTLSAGTGLAAIILLFLPGRKKYRAALGLGLVCVLSFTLGCNGGGGGSSGPVATITKLSVNSSKLASNDPTGFKFSINVIASVGANGQVQLFDGSTALGTATSVSNGSASITSAGLAPGTHAISAHYLGDSKTLASSSGTLNITSTGTATFVISATPAASNGTPTVNITIN